MAVKLNAAYSKKLGLPNYSSHSFAASVEVELTDLNHAAAETARLYGLLQASVDQQIQQPGYLPGNGDAHRAGNGDSAPGNGSSGDNGETPWNCSEKQKELILRLVDENGLDRNAVEKTAQDRFGAGVRELNKLQASGLITEILETCCVRKGNGNRGAENRSRQPAGKGGAK